MRNILKEIEYHLSSILLKRGTSLIHMETRDNITVRAIFGKK